MAYYSRSLFLSGLLLSYALYQKGFVLLILYLNILLSMDHLPLFVILLLLLLKSLLNIFRYLLYLLCLIPLPSFTEAMLTRLSWIVLMDFLSSSYFFPHFVPDLVMPWLGLCLVTPSSRPVLFPAPLPLSFLSWLLLQTRQNILYYLFALWLCMDLILVYPPPSPILRNLI